MQQTAPINTPQQPSVLRVAVVWPPGCTLPAVNRKAAEAEVLQIIDQSNKRSGGTAIDVLDISALKEDRRKIVRVELDGKPEVVAGDLRRSVKEAVARHGDLGRCILGIENETAEKAQPLWKRALRELFVKHVDFNLGFRDELVGALVDKGRYLFAMLAWSGACFTAISALGCLSLLAVGKFLPALMMVGTGAGGAAVAMSCFKLARKLHRDLEIYQKVKPLVEK